MCCLIANLKCVMIMLQLNGHNVTGVMEEEVLSMLRWSGKRLTMVLGRAVQNLRAPPTMDSLPDIVLYKQGSGHLGGSRRDEVS